MRLCTDQLRKTPVEGLAHVVIANGDSLEAWVGKEGQSEQCTHRVLQLVVVELQLVDIGHERDHASERFR